MQKRNWDNKIKRARLVEREILKWFRENIDENARLVEGYFPDYDIYSDKGCVEIKEDRLAHQTGSYALEHETHDDKPSGYKGTKATYFVLVDWEHVALVHISVLKDIINSSEKRTVYMGQTFKDGKRNKGYLVPRERVLNNPMVSVTERWFPVYEG